MQMRTNLIISERNTHTFMRYVKLIKDLGLVLQSLSAERFC